MAEVKSLYITETPSTEGGDSIPSFYFDALLSFTPQYNKTLSKYAISDKSEITNHSVKTNPTLSVSGLISRMPLKREVDNLVGYEDLSGRPAEALRVLKSWYEKDTELYLADQFDVYDRYVITSLTYSIEGSYDSLRFDINLEHVRRVGYQTGLLVTFENLSGEKQTDAKSNESKGSVSKKKQSTNATIFKLAEEGLIDVGISLSQSFQPPEDLETQ